MYHTVPSLHLIKPPWVICCPSLISPISFETLTSGNVVRCHISASPTELSGGAWSEAVVGQETECFTHPTPCRSNIGNRDSTRCFTGMGHYRDFLGLGEAAAFRRCVPQKKNSAVM